MIKEGEICIASVVSCIDFRIQDELEQFLIENGLEEKFDRIEMAGGVKDKEKVIKQLLISHNLHHPTEIWLFQHEDCGAYGLEKEIDSKEEIAIHQKDLTEMEKKIHEDIDSKLIVKKFFITLSGKIMVVTD